VFAIDKEKIPLFLVGKSFGGLLSWNMSFRMQGLFRGIACVVPFFRDPTDKIHKLRWIIKGLDTVWSSKRLTANDKVPSKDYYEKYQFYFEDKNTVRFVFPRTCLVFLQEQEEARKFASNTSDEGSQQTPVISIIAGKDTVVDNNSTMECMKQIKA